LTFHSIHGAQGGTLGLICWFACGKLLRDELVEVDSPNSQETAMWETFGIHAVAIQIIERYEVLSASICD
jgi:hypothetical protein